MDILTSLQGLGNFLLYFFAAVVAQAVFVAAYMAITPHRELALIAAGNVAAAVSLGGAVLGFTLPLASAIAHSVSLLDMLVWAVVALVVQLAAFFVIHLVLKDLDKRIESGNVAAGLTVGMASLAVGLVNAACMTS